MNYLALWWRFFVEFGKRSSVKKYIYFFQTLQAPESEQVKQLPSEELTKVGRRSSSVPWPASTSWPHALECWCHRWCWDRRHLRQAAGGSEAPLGSLELDWRRRNKHVHVKQGPFFIFFKAKLMKTHLSKTSLLRVSFVLVGVLRVFCRKSTFFFRLCKEGEIRNQSFWMNAGKICWFFLTEISLSAFARSACRDFTSSLVWFNSWEVFCN